MKKIVIDCRLIGNSGIGTYLREILPYLLKTKNKFFLIGKKEKLKEFLGYKNVELLECDIKIFSLKELFYFPHIKIINKWLNTQFKGGRYQERLDMLEKIENENMK